MGFLDKDWDLRGHDRRVSFETELQPNNLFETLEEYRSYFGDEFGVKELLKLQEIRTVAVLGEAITDFPELLLDQIGAANNCYKFHSIARALEDIAEIYRERAENE